MANKKRPGDPIEAANHALHVVNDVRLNMREADGSLHTALRLLGDPPRMSGSDAPLVWSETTSLHQTI